MTTPEVELRAAWRQLAGPTHGEALDHLLGLLRQPHRRYHTATHVMWVLRHLDEIVHALDPAAAASLDLPALRLAALFHDAVHDPRRTDNESASATLAERRAAELGWATDRCRSVGRLIAVTAQHQPANLDEEVLTDADLAILGSKPADYTAYVHAVRAEYSYVPDDAWCTGRAAVLHRFAAAPAIFHTPFMKDTRETRARANIAAELATLCGPGRAPD